jgi:hypothetical protein
VPFAIPVLGEDGTTYYIAVLPLQVGTSTQYMQFGAISDPVTGVGANVGPPGTNADNALSVQFVQNGIPFAVTSQNQGPGTSSITPITVLTTTTTILNANPARLGYKLYNEGPSVIFIALGATAAPSGGLYSWQIAEGEPPYEDNQCWLGQVSGIVGPTSTPSTILVTELTQ